MHRQATTSPPQRAAALTAGIALHVLVLLAVLAARSPAPARVAANPGPSVFSLAAPRPPAAHAPPVTRNPIPDMLRQQALAETVAKSATSASAAPGTTCATLDEVTAALLADPAAVDAVVRLPVESRSIADAVVIWNAGWSSAATTIDAPLAPARSVLERTLATMTEACLDEDVTGPRLVPVTVGEATTFLVIGSGVWRWRGLLAEPALAPGTISRETQAFSAG